MPLVRENGRSSSVPIRVRDLRPCREFREDHVFIRIAQRNRCATDRGRDPMAARWGKDERNSIGGYLLCRVGGVPQGSSYSTLVEESRRRVPQFEDDRAFEQAIAEMAANRRSELNVP
jgi:hypothetical protein